MLGKNDVNKAPLDLQVISWIAIMVINSLEVTNPDLRRAGKREMNLMK